jgi:hypothetical protein
MQPVQRLKILGHTSQNMVIAPAAIASILVIRTKALTIEAEDALLAALKMNLVAGSQAKPLHRSGMLVAGYGQASSNQRFDPLQKATDPPKIGQR